MPRLVLITTLVLAAGCAGERPRPTLREPIELSGMRFEAEVGEDGVVVTVVDPELLFERALAAQRARDCARAEPDYRRVADDFAEGRLAAPALYNAALCWHGAREDARARSLYTELVARYPEGRDARHARFQLASLAIGAERWDEALALADALLAMTLESEERLEALVRRAQAQLGRDELDAALEAARTGVRFLRSRSDEDALDASYFAAAVQFTLGEAHRRAAERIVLPPGAVDTQRPFLDRRAEHVLAAQRAYFDTIRLREPVLAAASGHAIGSLYDSFFEMIVQAPAPPPPSALAAAHLDEYEAEYHRALALLAKPLLRHSIRYWELALMLIERNGVPTEWTTRIEADLVRVRARLAGLPEGPEGLPEGG